MRFCTGPVKPRRSAPIAQQNGQVGRSDRTVAVQVGGAIIAVGARPPIVEQQGEIESADDTVAVQVAEQDVGVPAGPVGGLFVAIRKCLTTAA